MHIDLEPAVAVLLQELPELAGVYVFGSVSAETARAGSDVDLAVLCARRLEPALVQRVREKLASMLRREVDLIDLAAASTVLQMQVLGDGKVIAAPDATAIALFELRVLRDYSDLRFRRAAIDADIVARGRVHAR